MYIQDERWNSEVFKTGALQKDVGILRNDKNETDSMHFIAKKKKFFLLTYIWKQIKNYKEHK